MLLIIAALAFGTGPVYLLPRTVAAQVDATPTAETGPGNNTVGSTEDEAEAIFTRMTSVIAPIVALVLVVVIVWHRRSQRRR